MRAERSARWLAASGVLAAAGCSKRHHLAVCSFERNRQSVRPLRAATAETEGVISCGPLQLIASSRVTVINDNKSLAKGRGICEWALPCHCVTQEYSVRSDRPTV